MCHVQLQPGGMRATSAKGSVQGIRYCGLPEQLPNNFDNMSCFRGGVVLIEVKSFRVTDHRERMLDGSASQLELCVSVSHARPNPFQDEQLMYRLLI